MLSCNRNRSGAGEQGKEEKQEEKQEQEEEEEEEEEQEQEQEQEHNYLLPAISPQDGLPVSLFHHRRRPSVYSIPICLVMAAIIIALTFAAVFLFTSYVVGFSPFPPLLVFNC